MTRGRFQWLVFITLSAPTSYWSMSQGHHSPGDEIVIHRIRRRGKINYQEDSWQNLESLQRLIHLLRDLNCTSIFFSWRVRGERAILQLGTEGKLELEEKEKRRARSIETGFSPLLPWEDKKLFLSACQYRKITLEQIRMWLNSILSVIPLFYT